MTRTSGGVVITFGSTEPDIILQESTSPSSIALAICDQRLGELKEDLGLALEQWQDLEEERRAELLQSVFIRLADERAQTNLDLETLHRITFDESQALGGALRLLAQAQVPLSKDGR